MLDHLSIQCADLEKSAAFYDAVLATLGGERIMDFADVLGYGVPPMPDFWLGRQTSGEGFRRPTSRSPHPTGPPWMPSAPRPLSRPERRCSTSRVCGPSTTPTITAGSFATPTATTSKRSATAPSSGPTRSAGTDQAAALRRRPSSPSSGRLPARVRLRHRRRRLGRFRARQPPERRSGQPGAGARGRRPDCKWDVFIHMPAALAFPIGSRFYDWKYESEPEPFMDGRRVYHARGKVLGGS